MESSSDEEELAEVDQEEEKAERTLKSKNPDGHDLGQTIVTIIRVAYRYDLFLSES